MGQLLNGFKTLFHNNIAHRDFKPGNILVNDGVLKIADFGLSKPLFYRTEIMN
jgi:serine/threonine protein kinase